MVNFQSVSYLLFRVLGIVVGSTIILFLFTLWRRGGRAALPVGNNRPEQQLKPGIFNDIKNRTLGFQQIFAINLPERTDHRDTLTLAAAVSNITITFVPGVEGSLIQAKVLPDDHDVKAPPGAIGSWRAHVNAVREIVAQDLNTALIVEDDIDWDVRLKPILQDFALSSNAVLNNPEANELYFDQLSFAEQPRTLPYGSGWDVLWLGHCGMNIDLEKSRVFHWDDISVPESGYLKSWDANAISPMAKFPHHTRLVGTLRDGVCSLAYAITQSAARRILYELGTQHLDMAYDLMLARFCQRATCISVLPQIFDHHRRKGARVYESNIGHEEGVNRPEAKTENIRWSVRMNIEKILLDQTDYDDQFPDKESPPSQNTGKSIEDNNLGQHGS